MQYTKAVAIHTLFILFELIILTATCVFASDRSPKKFTLLGEAQRFSGSVGRGEIHGLQDSLTSNNARKSLVSKARTNNAMKDGMKLKGGEVWEKPRVGDVASFAHAGKGKANKHAR